MPPKRHFDRDSTDYDGKRKSQKSSGFYSQNKSSKVSTGASVFRVLCPASRTGSIIGKGGSVISQIRQETNAKVKIEETVPGCVERIISIKGSRKEAVEKDLGTETKETNATKDVGDDITKGNKEEDENKQGEDDDDNKNSVLGKDFGTENKSFSAQKALLLVFEKMIEGDALIDMEADENNKSTNYVMRLLVYFNQVGCILGKGGSAIKQMSSESGAEIRILPRDKLPVCASHSDELCQITGGLEEARKALHLVSKKLLDSPPRDSNVFPVTSSGPSSYSTQSHPKHLAFPPPTLPYTGFRDNVDYHLTATPLAPIFHDTIAPQDILTFRILCHSDKVGCVIGKAGTIIKTVQLDTGSEIKVLEGVAGTDDRVIVISGPAHPHDRISASQEALLRIQNQIFKFTNENFEKTVAARILVSSSQIGCLLGMGGAIIAEMRKETGAYIRILGKEQVPKCALENEEVVQITGEVGTVQDALLQITSRLRHHLFNEMFPSSNLSDQVPTYPQYMGRREHSPPGMCSNINQPFHNFEADGMPPRRGFPALEDQSLFMHNSRRPVHHLSERNPWAPQGLNEGVGPLGMPDYPGVHRRTAGFGGANQPAVITNTTVDVIVPRSLVPEIYGEDGESLKQIRQISDAKVMIGEPKPGATESVITISGTPEQTHAAQSLIQAFVMCESGAA